MNDRELLECAAKAIGTHYVPGEAWDEGAGWNPLESDGDALRLAVRLRIDLMLSGEIIGAFDNIEKQHAEKRGTCPYAATRRAIVKAAAAIGVRLHDRH